MLVKLSAANFVIEGPPPTLTISENGGAASCSFSLAHSGETEQTFVYKVKSSIPGAIVTDQNEGFLSPGEHCEVTLTLKDAYQAGLLQDEDHPKARLAVMYCDLTDAQAAGLPVNQSTNQQVASVWNDVIPKKAKLPFFPVKLPDSAGSNDVLDGVVKVAAEEEQKKADHVSEDEETVKPEETGSVLEKSSPGVISMRVVLGLMALVAGGILVSILGNFWYNPITVPFVGCDIDMDGICLPMEEQSFETLGLAYWSATQNALILIDWWALSVSGFVGFAVFVFMGWF